MFRKQRLYTVTGYKEQRLHWEEHGINIIVPKNALPSSITSCDIAVIPILEGSFLFPQETTPVSAIYAVGVLCKLDRPVRIEIQHCVELTQPSHSHQLYFVKAEHDGYSPPYQFDTCYDGQFEVGSEYGTLESSSFTFFSIIQEGYSRLWSLLGYSPAINSYKLLTFYEEAPKPRIWKVNFVVTRNIQSHIQVACTAEVI